MDSGFFASSHYNTCSYIPLFLLKFFWMQHPINHLIDVHLLSYNVTVTATGTTATAYLFISKRLVFISKRLVFHRP